VNCEATALITTLLGDRTFSIRKLHNHPVRQSCVAMRELRKVLGEGCVQHTARSYLAKMLYSEMIVR